MSNSCYSNAGQVRKSLSIKPHADGSGYFVSLSKRVYLLIFSCVLNECEVPNKWIIFSYLLFCMCFIYNKNNI